MTREEIKQMANTCNQYHSCAACPYNPEDISRFIGDRWKGGCPNYDRKLVYAMGKGYGDVSEYEVKKELLGSQIKVLKQRLNNKYIEVDNLNRDYHNSFERLKAQEREIKRLKEEYAKLQEQFAQYQMASDKEIAAQVKQAKIDVLNELKKRIKTAIDTYYNSDGGGYYLAEDVIDDIDELIEEVQNGENKS